MTAAVALRRLARPRRAWFVAAVLGAGLLAWPLLRGRDTLPLGGAELAGAHRFLNGAFEAVDASRNSNPVFLYGFNYLRLLLDTSTTFVQGLISQPAYGRPAPVLGWLGVTALATAVAWLAGNLRVALLACLGFVSFGLLGLWTEAMDTLALTLTAVFYSLLAGIPIGVAAGLRERVHRAITPVLDFMQTMPTFVYLAPLTLVFLIGPASATIATMIYAVPPVIRLTAHGIREIRPAALESGISLGATPAQLLTKVRLPLALPMIVVGINQTLMAALAMVTVAALIDAPGLGESVLQALESLDVGTAAAAGLAIVIMAVVLDRTTTAASVRRPRRRPWWLVTAVLAAAGIGAYLSFIYVWASTFPQAANFGPYVRRAVDAADAWLLDSAGGVTDLVRDRMTAWLLNPFQTLLTDAPWWWIATVAVAVALFGLGVRAAVLVGAGVAGLLVLGLWQDSMVTLAATVVATALTALVGVVAGVWMGRSSRADGTIRPVLDAAQTLPPFVYLVPVVGLFGATRFTGILAAVIFAIPVTTKLVAEGIRGVRASAVEASGAAGATAWQTIIKVQLPLARASVTLAVGQGLIYVLSMVVVGGLVGAGALGYQVVAGFSQHELRGKGLAAGLAIVVLGIVLDRIMRAAASRAGAQRA
ncbi:MAG: ABC transporter permease subunit [Streptosporangiales bacterium]|nr:ABC transporter permease subunit [Streptosporangiales bacterium]